MRYARISSMAMLAAAAATIGFGGSIEPLDEQQRRILSKMPRGYANDGPRKQRRATDRSRKQYLLKGIRP